MGLHQLFSSLLIRWFGGIALVFSAFSVIYAQSPTAPTASPSFWTSLGASAANERSRPSDTRVQTMARRRYPWYRLQEVSRFDKIVFDNRPSFRGLGLF